MSDIKLSPDQRAAVASDARAIVVTAGAGSGKTEVIAHRIERLLAESRDEDYRIVALSYTVKAAEELRQRLAERLGGLHKRVDADTIHGFALSMLRQFGTRIGLPPEPEILTQDEDRVELLQEWVHAQGGRLSDASSVFSRLDIARARCEPAPYLFEWRAALAARGALDFPAVLERATDLLDGPWVGRNLRRTYRHLVVDEAQNLTPAQYAVLRGLIGDPSSPHMSAMLVGDARQSIVGFAGADPTLLSQFAQEYRATVLELHTNYRSARRIVLAGTAVARALGTPSNDSNEIDYPAEGTIEIRQGRDEREEGAIVAKWVQDLLNSGLNPAAVAPGESVRVKPEEIAALGRTAASLRLVRQSLTALNIDWAEGSVEDEWVASKAAKAVVDLIAFRSAPGHQSVRRRLAAAAEAESLEWHNASEILAASNDLNLRKIGSIADLPTPAEFLDRLATLEIDDEDWATDVGQLVDAWKRFIDATGESGRTFGNLRQHIFRMQRGNDIAPGVRVLTVHKAQGREFKAVALVGCNDGQFPDFRATSKSSREWELRAFYVAVTRASRQLLLTRPLARKTRYGPRRTDASPFLKYASVGEAFD